MTNLPEDYTPSSLRPAQPERREQVLYAIGEEKSSSVLQASYGMWHGPNPNLYEMLEVEGKTDNSVIVRFNLDGTDEVIYRWRQFRDGKPPRWKKERGVE